MINAISWDQINDLSHFNESSIYNPKGVLVGHSTVAIDKNGKAIGGGIHKDINVGRRICIAESLERSCFKNLCNDPSLREKFLIDLYPTTCGFAAGFDSEKTKHRAICEALERWIWSKWIDDGHILNEVYDINFKSDIADTLCLQFDDRILFHKYIQINVENKILNLQCGIFLGIRGNGIFPGSRVCGMSENPWEHAIIESWRHLHINEALKNNSFQNDFYTRRIRFFGDNASLAMQSIRSGNKADWPTFNLDFCKEVDTPNFFLWRALTFNFIPWDQGPIERFVY